MKWVHLWINSRVRVLGRLGCTGAFTHRTEQHARGLVKKSLSTIQLQLKTGLQIKIKKTCKVMSVG